jgi:hypothetical protein
MFQLRDAKRVWVSCPVQSRCLEWAVVAGIDHGVWGGLSEERRTLSTRDTGVPAGASSSQQSRRIDVWFDAGGDGVAVERGMGLIGVVSLVDEHPDRPIDRRHVV